METLILIASSVLITLGIVLVIWLISSVRSAKHKLEFYNEDNSEIHRKIEEESQNIVQNLEKLQQETERDFADFYHDLDKRFDSSYRTMYELRDSIQSDIDRLIEKDLQTNKSITELNN